MRRRQHRGERNRWEIYEEDQDVTKNDVIQRLMRHKVMMREI